MTLLALLACVFITDDEIRARECGWSDRDGDGACDIDDCAPDDATRAPHLPERCNGEDDDCDGEIDDGLYADDDGDGWGVAAEGACFASWVARDGDCDDADDTVFPGADDRCDGKQNDCATPWSLADEAGLVTHIDADGVVTDLSPADPTEVTAIELPTAGDVYVCASPEDPLLATFRVTHLDGDLRLVGVSTADPDDDAAPDDGEDAGDDTAGRPDEPALATLFAARTGTVVRVEATTGKTFTMVDLAITMGGRENLGDGGGVWTAADTDVHIARCQIVNNQGRFGGVWSQGALEMVGATIRGNSIHDLSETAEPEFFAAGLRTEGPSYVLDTLISGNIGKDVGGGVDAANDTLVLNNVMVAGNSTAGQGAGIVVRGTLRLVGAMVRNNSAEGDYAGGGIYVEHGELYCTGSTVQENTSAYGAGITVQDEAFLFADGCVVTGNTDQDGEPAEIWAGGELWSPAGDECFQCGEDGCAGWACP